MTTNRSFTPDLEDTLFPDMIPNHFLKRHLCSYLIPQHTYARFYEFLEMICAMQVKVGVYYYPLFE